MAAFIPCRAHCRVHWKAMHILLRKSLHVSAASSLSALSNPKIVSSRTQWDNRDNEQSACSSSSLLDGQQKQLYSRYMIPSTQDKMDHSVLFATNSKDVTGRSSHDVGTKGDYPEGKPTGDQLQHIVLRLSATVPNFFTLTQDYTIYRQEMEFINRIQMVVIKTLPKYMSHLAMIRIMAHLRYAYVAMKVLNITPMLEDGTVRMRWRVQYVGGIEAFVFFWRYKFWNREHIEKSSHWMDGYSTFWVGGDGLIYRHLADKMMPDDEIAKSKKPNLADKIKEKIAAPKGAPVETPTPT